jgi:hypothetical protein
LSIKAQDSAIQLPDSIGKYLFESFINKADLNRPEVIFAEDGYSNPKEMWPSLLDKVDKYNFGPENTEYYNTFFEQIVEYQVYSFPASLHVAMKQDDKIYAFRANVSWDGNRWQVEKIDTDIYLYSGIWEERGFNNITNDEVVAIAPDYEYNRNFRSAVDISRPKTLPLPDSFSEKVLKLLCQEAPFGNDEIFLTRQEYIDTEGARIIKTIDRLLESGTDLESGEKEKIMSIYNNPGLMYDELASNWDMLPESLKEEFGDNIGELNIKNIETSISNRNAEMEIIDVPAVSATISMPLFYNGKNAGIYFSAIRYKDMWKLSHIQGFAYGISTAENMDDGIEIEGADVATAVEAE